LVEGCAPPSRMVEERRRGRGKVRDLELSIGDAALAMEVLFVAGRSGSRVGSRSPSRGDGGQQLGVGGGAREGRCGGRV
jgi:hypothetical protein